VLSKQEAATSAMVVTTLLLISKPLCVLFDLVVTHSFMFTPSILYLNFENKGDRNQL